ncbi:hypothetical protein EYF80_014338 [Liparis tanakae]|uniref:Uncharacterized protein n=1 Tax=Liparis tanakae TaxID=230148 RepID=A0A4Z2IC03_9TELE|nr:hypothetical protein EYF80_014338 [Liparis tanakae]
MFFSCVFLIPDSAPAVAAPPPPMATASFSSRFCAPFLARCSSCLATVASVRLVDGTMRTGFRWRGLFRRPGGRPGLAGGGGEAGAPGAAWYSAGACGSAPLARKALCFPSAHSTAADSRAAAAAAASALRRSAEGGRPRRRLGAPGRVLSRDLSGASFVARSLFRPPTLDSPRPPLGSFASAQPGGGGLPAPCLSSSVSTPGSEPVRPPSPPAAAWWLLHAFLLLEDGGRPLLFSPVPGGLPGSRLAFSAGRSGPSAFACVVGGEGRGEGQVSQSLVARSLPAHRLLSMQRRVREALRLATSSRVERARGGNPEKSPLQEEGPPCGVRRDPGSATGSNTFCPTLEGSTHGGGAVCDPSARSKRWTFVFSSAPKTLAATVSHLLDGTQTKTNTFRGQDDSSPCTSHIRIREQLNGQDKQTDWHVFVTGLCLSEVDLGLSAWMEEGGVAKCPAGALFRVAQRAQQAAVSLNNRALVWPDRHYTASQ